MVLRLGAGFIGVQVATGGEAGALPMASRPCNWKVAVPICDALVLDPKLTAKSRNRFV
jgi:hypothetical protein